jgi:hypothetical protein
MVIDGLENQASAFEELAFSKEDGKKGFTKGGKAYITVYLLSEDITRRYASFLLS